MFTSWNKIKKLYCANRVYPKGIFETLKKLQNFATEKGNFMLFRLPFCNDMMDKKLFTSKNQ